jgi:hypothetical protein
MSIRVELFAQRVDFGQCRFLESRDQLLEGQFGPGAQALDAGIFGRQRSFEAVLHRQQFASKRSMRTSPPWQCLPALGGAHSRFRPWRAATHHGTPRPSFSPAAVLPRGWAWRLLQRPLRRRAAPHVSNAGWPAAVVGSGTVSFVCIDGGLPENGKQLVWGEFRSISSFCVSLRLPGNRQPHIFFLQAALLLLAFRFR